MAPLLHRVAIRKEERRKKVGTTGVKYNGLPITMGDHK